MRGIYIIFLFLGMVFLFGLAYAQFGFCGDGVCDERLEEDAQTCPEDCGGTDEFCGDGICNEEIEENVETCPEDCEGIPPEDEDWDMDGIPNAEDECPDDPETYNDYQDEDGCPDEEQGFCGNGACEEFLEENFETCPEDCEGIPPEDEDWDMDGIPNAEDECPDDPETYNDYQDEDGCPDEEQEDTGPTTVIILVHPFEHDPELPVQVRVRAEDPDGILGIIIIINDEPVQECIEVEECDYEGGPYAEPPYIGAVVRDGKGIEKYTDQKEPWTPDLSNVTPICDDSDGGKNYNAWGFVTTAKKGAVHPGSGLDSCVNTTHLTEYYCDTNGFMGSEVYKCPVGCCNGACGTDSDGDGLLDKCDNCPNTANANQSDVDSDGIGDACDNCASYNPSQYDSDKDGIADACDNCPYVSSTSQTDTDGDGIGDLCDNCPSVSNYYQTDTDNDTIGDFCDNCITYANKDQADMNNDNTGDACDCTDGFKGPNEVGADCGGGGPCLAPCPKCIPLLENGKHSDKIDVVFIGNGSYATNMSLVAEHAMGLIFQGYFGDPLLNTTTNREKFNFYYYNTTGGLPALCKNTVPSNLWKDCSFADSVAIMHTFGWRDCATGKTFSIGFNNFRTLRHESGHAIFGLADEYCCDGGYWQPSPYPNIYSSLSNCQNDAANVGKNASQCFSSCPKGTTCNWRGTGNKTCCGNGWWKSDADTCTMVSGNTFDSGCQRRVNWVMSKYK